MPGVLDTDGDGIPDNVETAAGLNPEDPADAVLDKDGDGMPTWPNTWAAPISMPPTPMETALTTTPNWPKAITPSARPGSSMWMALPAMTATTA